MHASPPRKSWLRLCQRRIDIGGFGEFGDDEDKRKQEDIRTTARRSRQLFHFTDFLPAAATQRDFFSQYDAQLRRRRRPEDGSSSTSKIDPIKSPRQVLTGRGPDRRRRPSRAWPRPGGVDRAVKTMTVPRGRSAERGICRRVGFSFSTAVQDRTRTEPSRAGVMRAVILVSLIEIDRPPAGRSGSRQPPTTRLSAGTDDQGDIVRRRSELMRRLSPRIILSVSITRWKAVLSYDM